MQRIREWMDANPDQAKEVRRQNKSYVFFRITDLATEDEAIGAEGVPLVPGRSIAVDRALHVYGTPFFIEADLPIANEKAATKFRRLMVAQDTGSAIVGPARADIYFGAGDEAARMAGRIKNPGHFVMLLPRELDPVEAGRDMPLPPERPSAFSLERRPPWKIPRRWMCRCRNRNRHRSGAKTRRRRALRRSGKSDESDEPAAAIERRRTGAVDRLRALDQAVAVGEASGQNRPEVFRNAVRREHSRAAQTRPPPVTPVNAACGSASAGAARPAAKTARRARPRADRRAARPARHDANQAHAALLRFLNRAQASGAKIALVVTGKGLRKSRAATDAMPKQRGVLRRQVPMWLALPEFRPLVVGFEDAHVGHGGEGALYVRLRRGK